MTNPSEQLEVELLEAARRGLEPSAGELDGAWTRLAARVSAGPGPSSVPPAVGQLPGVGRFFGWGAAGGLVLGLGVGFGVGHEVGRVRAPASAVTVDAPRVALAPHVDVPGAAEPEPLTESQPESPALARGNKRRADLPAEEPVVPPGLALREELDFLRRAQTALRAGNPRLALGLMLELEQRQPQGALRLERDTTRLLALCALGETEEASSRARTLLSDPGADVYAERIKRACGATVTETEGLEHQPASPRKDAP